MRHEEYKECLQEQKTFRHEMNTLRSLKHQIYGQHINKVSLSPFDSKRYILDDGVTALAYGNTGIKSKAM